MIEPRRETPARIRTNLRLELARLHDELLRGALDAHSLEKPPSPR